MFLHSSVLPEFLETNLECATIDAAEKRRIICAASTSDKVTAVLSSNAPLDHCGFPASDRGDEFTGKYKTKERFMRRAWSELLEFWYVQI